MTTAKQPAMFYIRMMNPKDGGFHRVGCVVMKKVNKTHVAVGWSFCNKSDPFNPKFAKVLAMNRLSSSPNVIQIKRDSEGVYFADMMNDLKLTTNFIKNYGSGQMARFIYRKNMNAATGAYQDLFPRTKSKV